MKQIIEQAAQAIREADALLITAGAGIGVDSGLPDFRGNSGFWRAYPPMQKLGISFTAMANPAWFHNNPRLAWGFYGHRLNLYRNTIPHEGFTILRKIAAEKPSGYFVFTSNVDGQFQKAGFNRENIYECHGSIHHIQCATPCNRSIRSSGDIRVTIDETTFLAAQPLPVCPDCSGIARPNILMFGDWNWIPDRSQEQADRMEAWVSQRARSGKKLAIIELGAGEAVPTVRMESEDALRRFETARLIRINPRDESVPPGQIAIPLGALEAVRRIAALL
jgi:NAD-dependent SIR2 family protein deacetylase